MKEITKAQVIGLMDSINREGIENGLYDIVKVHDKCAASERIVCGDERMMEPGTYCVVYSDEPDFSNYSFIDKFVNENLKEENIDIILGDTTNILVICLGEF